MGDDVAANAICLRNILKVSCVYALFFNNCLFYVQQMFLDIHLAKKMFSQKIDGQKWWRAKTMLPPSPQHLQFFFFQFFRLTPYSFKVYHLLGITALLPPPSTWPTWPKTAPTGEKIGKIFKKMFCWTTFEPHQNPFGEQLWQPLGASPCQN